MVAFNLEAFHKYIRYSQIVCMLLDGQRETTKGADHDELTMAGPRPPWRKHGREACPVEKVGVVAFSELESFIIGRDVCVCFFIMSLFVRFQPEWNQTESNRIKPYTSL